MFLRKDPVEALPVPSCVSHLVCPCRLPLSFSDSDDAAENAFVTAFHRIMAMDHTALSRPVLYCPRLITLLLNSKEQGSFIAFLAFRLIYLLIKSFLFGTFLFVIVVVAKAVHF